MTQISTFLNWHSLWKAAIAKRCCKQQIAYTTEVAKLKTPALISAGASIGSTESAHAAAIRATFKALGVGLEIVPSSFVSADNRSAWVLQV